MKAIIAVNNLGYIGKNNALIWHCSDDLKHFKKLTEGQRLLAGYNTYYSLPPLKNRIVILDERGSFYHDVDWCIGGAKTYEKYCHLFTELHISKIDNNDVGDVLSPTFANLNPNCKIYHYSFQENKKCV